MNADLQALELLCQSALADAAHSPTYCVEKDLPNLVISARKLAEELESARRLLAMRKSPPETSGELAAVARLMRRFRLDSVEMPSGLKVLKTTHAPFAETATPEAVDATVRRLEALGLVNATDDSGRVPTEQDDVLFVASRAPELSLEDFRPMPPGAEESDGHDE